MMLCKRSVFIRRESLEKIGKRSFMFWHVFLILITLTGSKDIRKISLDLGVFFTE